MTRSQAPSRYASIADLGPDAQSPSKKRAHPEEKLHRAVAVLFRTIFDPLKVLYFHVPNGGHRDKIAAAKLKAMGTLAGVPDFYVAWAGGTLWIELKAEKGSLSIAQEVFGDRVLAIGHGFETCRSVDGVLSVLKAYGVPMRAKVAA